MRICPAYAVYHLLRSEDISIFDGENYCIEDVTARFT